MVTRSLVSHCHCSLLVFVHLRSFTGYFKLPHSEQLLKSSISIWINKAAAGLQALCNYVTKQRYKFLGMYKNIVLDVSICSLFLSLFLLRGVVHNTNQNIYLLLPSPRVTESSPSTLM